MIFKKPSVQKVESTPFSDFIRKAKAEEKKRVYADVLQKATAEQNRILGRSGA